MSYNADSLLIITINGHASIPRPAERAVLNVQVSASGENKQWATDEVTTTAKHIREMLQTASPNEQTLADQSIVAHWNMTSLTSTSRQKRDAHWNVIQSAPPIYEVNLFFNIRIRKFTALGSFATKLAEMAHVTLHSIEWVLTGDTRKAHESELRRLAAVDALKQAQDYGSPLGITKFRPISIVPHGASTASWNKNSNMMIQQQQQQQQQQMRQHQAQMQQVAQVAPGITSNASGSSGTVSLLGEAASDLAFYPESVNMSVGVEVKFVGE